MALVYEQTRALMWKCLIMRVRHKMMTFIECIFPMAMLIVFMLVVVKIGEHPVGDESAFGDPMPIQNFSNPDSRISETLLRYSVMNNNLLYMPDHPCSTRIMRRAKLMMHLRAGCPMTRTKIIPVSKESNMIDLFYAFGRQSGDELTSAINFMGSCESWYEFAVQKLQFQLYTRGNVKSQGFSKKTFAGPFEYNMYLPPYNTFVELLILLSDARIMSAFEMKLDPRLADERWMNASSDTSGRLILDRILDQIERFDPFKNQTTNNSSNAAKQDDSLAVSAQNRFRDMNLRNRTKLAQNRTEINNIVIDLINAQLFSELRNRLQSPSFRSSIGDYFNSEYFDTLTDRLETGANSVVTNANNETNVVFPDLSRIRKRIRALIAVLNDHEKLRLLNVSLITAYPELINMRIPIPLHDIEINRYVYPAYTQRPPPMITDTLPYIVVFGFIVSLPLLMKSITEEKNRGIRELFRLMGLTQRAYVASIVAGYLPVMLFHSIVLSILIGVPVLNGSAIFPHCSLSLMIVMFLLYGITSVLFTLCLSVPFQRPVLSLMCTALAHIFTTLPDYLLEPALVGNSNFVCFFRVLSCLLPNMSLNYGIRLLSAKELYSQPQEWSNLFDMDYHYQALSIGIVMCVQLWSCVFYLFLYWYLDNVWPWQQGVPKSPFFIFSPRFWQSVGSGPSAKSHLNFMASHAIRPLRNQGEYFESQPEAQSYAFRLRDVRKEFGSGKNRNVALDNVNLDLPEGELCVLLGHNGAGKSTLMNLITGVAVPTQGQVVINGFDMRTETLQARASISFCPQHNALYDELSALEHMWLFGVLRTASVSATLDRDQETKSKSESVSQFGSVEHVRLLTELGLREKAHQAAQGYSGGQKRKLCLAIALLGNPQLIILDEPTSGMDPEARRSVVEVLLRHRRRRSILLTTHFMEEADAVADRICIMSSGKVKCYGSPSFLRATFGAGYKLRIAKATGFQPSHRLHLIALLSQHFPRGEIIQESVGELIYALDSGAVEESDALDGSTDRLEQPLSAVETQTSDQDHGRLARFFAQFEPVRDLLHVSSCGLSVTTLEDVFLRVVTMDSPIPHLAINDDNVSATTDWSEMTSNVDLSSSVDPKENTSSWSLAISDDFETVRCKDNRSVSPLPMRSSLLSSQPTGNLTKSGKLKSNAFSLSASSQQNFKNCAVETFPLLTGWPLQMNRLRALIIKRIHFAKRYYSMLIFQLLLPLCMFMLLFELDSFLRRKLTVSQRFELRSDKMYGSTEGFVQFSPEVKRRINWERLQDAFNQTFIDERVRMHVLPSDVNPQDYQIELTKQLSIDQYLSHHLYGFSIYMANEAQLPMYRDGKKRSSLWESIDWLIDNEKNKQEEITAYSPLTGSKSLPDKSSDAWVASSMDPQQIKQADKMRLENDKLATFPNQSKGNKSNAVQALQWHEIEELLRARRNGLGPQHGLSEQDLQLLAAIHKTSQEMSLTVQVWHQNEALHALPLGVQILYQSLFRWFNITDDGRPIHLHSWNRPMRTQFEYLTIIEFMHLFKILWGIFCSIAFSFMSASYVLQPAAERSSQAKLLQQMTGTPLWLYWIAHAVFDMIFHLILSALLITVFQLLDSKHLFTAHFESMLSMFVLLVLFGACMLPICYCVSLWISTSNTAFSASLGINLVGGVFLTLIDYIFGTLYNRKYMSTSVRTISLNLFRMFPLFSLTKAINKLYLVGSHYGACSYFTESFLEMNCVKNVPYIGCCKSIFIKLLLSYAVFEI